MASKEESAMSLIQINLMATATASASAPQILLPVSVASKHDCKALLDTGSSVSLISEKTMKKLGQTLYSTKKESVGNTVNGKPLEIVGASRFDIEFNGKAYHFECYVSANDIPADILLGADFIDKFHVIPDITKQIVYFGGLDGDKIHIAGQENSKEDSSSLNGSSQNN